MLSIQKAGITDIPLIRRLAYEIWPSAYGNILSAGQLNYMLKLIYSEEALASQMTEGQQFYIAYHKDEAIGFAAVGPYGNATYKLHKIYLLPQIQGKGAGKQLLQYVIEIAKAGKVEWLVLNVNRNNPALHFYRKIGFEISEEADIDIGNGYYMNDYIMKLSI